MTRRAWRGRSGLAGAVVIVGLLGLRWWTLHRAFYTQDDYLMLSRSTRAELGPTFLLQGYSGHLFPGGFLWAWLDARLARMDWAVSILPVVAGIGVVSVLGWLVLTRLLGESWWRLPLLVVLLGCPLPLWSTQWWAVAIQFLPVTGSLLLALLAHLRWRDTRPVVAAALVVGAMILGLCFQERGLLVIPVVGTLALATARGGVRERVTTVLRRDRWTALALAVAAAGYIAVHRVLVPIDSGPALSTSERLTFGWDVLARNALPGLWGGPWRPDIPTYGIVQPPVAAVVVALTATGLLAVWTARRLGSRALWAGSVTLVAAAVNTVLLFGGRAGAGVDFALIPRYTADLVVPVVLTLALLVKELEPASAAWRRPALIAAAYAASAAVTWTAVVPATDNPVDREWVTTARSELRANPNAVLFDGGIPDRVMVNWFEDEARASVVLAAAPERPVFDLPSPELRILNASGRLVDVTLVDEIAAAGGTRPCGHNVTRDPTPIEFETAVPDDDRRVLRLTYYTDTGTYAAVTFGGVTQQVPIRNGANAVELVVSGAVRGFTMHVENPTSTLCLVEATLGRAYPAEP